MDETGKRGVLILVVGPSGAGKDTLLNGARARLAGNATIVFPKRVVTRFEPSGEDHDIATFDEFECLRAEGSFFLHWRAHGLYYGIPISVLDHLSAGRTIVVNISRRLVDQARAKWVGTEVISIVVAPEILRERLTLRGRETLTGIEERVRRATDEACAVEGAVHMLDNSGPLTTSLDQFVALLLILSKPGTHETMAAQQFEGVSV